jgi:RHS repeat-associated protein
MKKTVGSETTYYFYGATGLLCEFTTTNTGATQAASTDRATYRTSDKLDSAVLIINASGTVIENNRTLPYGEAWLPEVASSNDKKFTSYERDFESGLDYAMNRYLANSYGRFVSADPKGIGAVDIKVPSTLNMYIYVKNDPINFTDPEGLESCAAAALVDAPGIPTGSTIGSFINGNSDLAIFSQTIYTEARVAWDTNAMEEKAAIAAVIMNRWQIVNGYFNLQTGAGRATVIPFWGQADGTIKSIVTAPDQFAVWSDPTERARARTRLNSALNSEYGSNACNSLVQAIGTAAGFWSERNRHVVIVDSANRLAYTSFGSGNGANRSWYESVIGSYGSNNVFYGVRSLLIMRRVPGRASPTVYINR